MLINDASITGSLIVNASASFQNINVAGNIIPDTTNIHNLGSTDKYFKEIYVSTGSINFVDETGVIGTLNAGTITAIQSNTSSANNRLDSIESVSASLQSFTASISQTNTFTSSATARLNSIEAISASNISRLNSIEIISASNLNRLSALETTSASVDTLNTNQNNRLNSLEDKTGSLAITGSNTFFGTQIFSGSVYVKENLIVQGSSSLQNITASAVDIGTNRIILNANTPSVRYAGISVYDSGSNLGTGSLWWDSVDNHWLYEHPSDSAAPYNSAILISGPKNAGSLGEELELVNNYIVKAVGGDHISSSAIYDDGTTIGLKSNTEVSGTFKVGAYTSSFAGLVGIGTNIPANKLEVFDTQTTTPQFQIRETSSAYHRFGILKSGSFVHFVEPGNDGTSASEYLMTINMNGNNVGIGTSSPSYPLDLYGLSSGTTSTLLRLKNGYNDTSTGIRARWDFASLAGAYLDVTTNSGGTKSMTLYLSAANEAPSQVLAIAGSSGNITSIGTITSQTNGSTFGNASISGRAVIIQAGSANQVIQFKNAAGGDGTLYAEGTSTAMHYRFDTYSTSNALFVANGGNIGIGTNNPSTALTIYKPIDSNAYGAGTRMIDFKSYFTGYDVDTIKASIYAGVSSMGSLNTQGGYLAFMTSNNGSLAERVRIEKSGYVGIGVTNPSNALQVSGNIYSTDTVFGRNLKPYAFAGAAAGSSPTSATIPLGYSTIDISSPCDNQLRVLMNNINDVKGYFWVTLGDAASKDTANYFMAMTSPAYGVYNFGAVSYQDNGWNTGGFEFSYDSSGGSFRLLVRCNSYYNSGNTAYGTIYFLRME